ncbi:uncharacterized protein cfap97d2 [Labrus mixtus]|uniref:uncharacterized protein cfap97d2 n=1 Tax=Labrus mixtus TaxID=508554 RepID=UPI0029C05BD5|nr:uncharacterized protein cfap97d2 [Labrus mixtus]
MKAHLAYQPCPPSANKYLQFKWDKASYDAHREKVKSAKSMLNITAPKTYSHLTQGLKKQKLADEWNLKVQRENNILLEKIFHIMKTSGGVDDRNYYKRKSLGKERKHQELLRITKENQKILFRLDHCKSTYNVKNFHKDWHKNVKLMDSIARYPRGWTNQKEGQEKAIKKSSGCGKDQKISRDITTKSLASNKAMGKVKSKGNIQVTADSAIHTAETSPPLDGSKTSNNPHTPETPKKEPENLSEG